MKKKIAGFAALLVIGIAALLVLRPAAPEASTAFEAAFAVEQALEEGKEHIVLRTPGRIDEAEMFRVLEAVSPYAFSLYCTSYEKSGRMEVEVEQERPAAQEQVQLLAEQIAQQQTAGLTDEREKLRALHDYLVRSCRYDQATAQSEGALDGEDVPFTAYGALVDGQAVCAGYARAFMLLCRAAGLDALYIADEGMDHAWNAVEVDGQVYYIDCTYDDPVPDRGDYVSDEYFLLTADALSRTHIWDRMFYSQIMDAKWPK